MDESIAEYFRCPKGLVQIEPGGELSEAPAFFRFSGSMYYGRHAINSQEPCSELASDNGSSVVSQPTSTGKSLHLPFDVAEVVDNLRRERYKEDSTLLGKRLRDSEFIRSAYYAVRPTLPAGLRSHLHKIHLNGWRRITFPAWPIDTSVDRLMETAVRLCLQEYPDREIPFIWFWPQGYPACALMTHDVEDQPGRTFCLDLLAIDESYGIKSSFQIIPEGRYDANQQFIESIKNRGFEVNVHDLNHDGCLFKNRELFLKRAAKIDFYRTRFGAEGFRSGSMYRRADWLSDLDFTYDMSVPNAAHLEPQRGGCCTVMPFKIGNLVELPLTVTQDYSLFRILQEHSMELWDREIEYLIRKHGLISIIIHPDYIIDRPARDLYELLLRRLIDLRDKGEVWMPLPRDVARWWNLRSRMRMESVGGEWAAVGEGSEEATVAHAYLENGRMWYRVGDRSIEVSDETSCPRKNI